MLVRLRLKLFMDSVRLGTIMLMGLTLLSLFDAIATDAGIRMQAVSEANPFAAALYEMHPVVFYGYKTVMPLMLLVLNRYIRRPSYITKLIMIVTLVYALLAVYHMAWLYKFL
ncbi:DUF5658 family protein [Paenibacillus kobensis]|uniref:DUF5658 family protein n=1 Tax=Paenibacillus kobensis TaxID=59841 RepID=UPI000FDC0144|nr:DUF5658 family protein [Paenibacillus kobensis]